MAITCAMAIMADEGTVVITRSSRLIASIGARARAIA